MLIKESEDNFIESIFNSFLFDCPLLKMLITILLYTASISSLMMEINSIHIYTDYRSVQVQESEQKFKI
ncbi:hypothetical protein BLOT_001453 [Blomia tropicalis]|nr:hypothetical protein BLOT_001453 [Blomia tropicalis]